MSTRLPHAAVIAAALAMPGCAGVQTATAVSYGGPLVGPCTDCLVTGPAGLYASVGIGAAVANAVVHTMFGAMLLYDGLNWRAPPAMDENRTVHEQDCGRPIGNPGANLKCKAPEGAARP